MNSKMRSTIGAIAAVVAAVSLAAPAGATTIVTSLDAFRAGVGATPITSTANPGNYNTTQSPSPVTSSITLNDETQVSFSNPAAVTSPPPGQFPFTLSSGFSGELFVPQDAEGNGVPSETISFGSGVAAFGFEVAPYSGGLASLRVLGDAPLAIGLYAITVTLSDGQSATMTLPGGNPFDGTTDSQFFGFYGGGVTSMTIEATDPNGFGFGNFVDALLEEMPVAVPEPGSAALVLAGVVAVLRARFRSAPFSAPHAAA